jgi:uncharacterized protein
MEEVDFNQLQRWTAEHAASQHASELHGLIAGLICAGSKMDAAARRSALTSWLGDAVGSEAILLLDRVHDETWAGLVDEAFGFRLLIPNDEADVTARTHGVASWCSGFLAGFGLTGRYRNNELSDDLKEVMADLERIASFSDEVPDDEDNEVDLIEIGEYVRMSALLVYTECADRAVH